MEERTEREKEDEGREGRKGREGVGWEERGGGGCLKRRGEGRKGEGRRERR